jgi:hypothetical protein
VLAIAVRQRGHFGALLTLICAHALLHRASRDRDQTGAIIATAADYATVRELVADVFAEGIEATVPVTVRETVWPRGRRMRCRSASSPGSSRLTRASPVAGCGTPPTGGASSIWRPEEVGRRGSWLAIRCRKW